MTEEMKQKRDELAKVYGTNRFPIQNIETRKDFTQDINFARRMTHTDSFQSGFNACYKLMEAENAELREVIDELSKSMSAISELSSHMKIAGILFANKQGLVSLPKEEVNNGI